MKWLARQLKNQSGFTLVEVLISMLILSIVITSACTAFVYAARVTQDNKLNMVSINLANKSIEYIRSLQFVEVGTVGGDPAGVIDSDKIETVDGINYRIYTSINWEEEAEWDVLGNAEWDYKSVRVTVVPQYMEGNQSLTKVIETYIARESTQPPLTGANMQVRLIRGWNTVPGTLIPVSNARISLIAGPDAPMQVQTSSKGAARFIDLTPGTYTVNIDPSNLGMILHPEDEANWTMSIVDFNTENKVFKAEYPCQIRITLKDLAGNPISIDPSVTGSISIQVPYPVGTVLNKDFTSINLDSLGHLPLDFISGLWPVGLGYSGNYTISNVLIPECQYLGSYEGSGTSETLWPGKFDGPGTYKSITCYFGTIPDTPLGIDTSWVDAGLNIVSGLVTYIAYNIDGTDVYSGKFYTADLEDTIVMPSNTSEFNAASIFFENTGSVTNSGLYISNASNLILHTGMVVFRGKVEVRNGGKITLRTNYQEGCVVGGSEPISIDGSVITGGLPGVRYGKLYLAKPMLLEGSTIVEPGGYYYYNDLQLPNAESGMGLIPITKDNYID